MSFVKPQIALWENFRLRIRRRCFWQKGQGTAAARQRELERAIALIYALSQVIGRAIADTDQALALAASQGQQLKDIYATRCLTSFCLQECVQGLQAFEQLIALISAQSSSHTSKASTSIGSIASD